LQIWKDYVEVADEVRPEDERQERKVDFKSVVVTEVTSDLRVYVQFTEDVSTLLPRLCSHEYPYKQTRNKVIKNTYKSKLTEFVSVPG